MVSKHNELDLTMMRNYDNDQKVFTLARHHFVKNISCSKHLEEEASCPIDDEDEVEDARGI